MARSPAASGLPRKSRPYTCDDIYEDQFGKKLEDFRSDVYKKEYLPRVKAFPKVHELFERIRQDSKRIVLASSAKGDKLNTYKADRAGSMISPKPKPTIPSRIQMFSKPRSQRSEMSCAMRSSWKSPYDGQAGTETNLEYTDYYAAVRHFPTNRTDFL